MFVDEILAADPSNKAKIELIEIDLESFESIRKGAEEFLGKESKLNVLVANAGVMATPEGRTKDGWETQFGTNHLGHFLLFQLLKDTLLGSATPGFPSRVVAVSSVGHRASTINFDNVNLDGAYDQWTACGQAKTANIWFANEIDRRYGSKNLHTTSLHQGGIDSGLTVHVRESMADMIQDPAIQAYFKSAEQGAATSTYAALSDKWKSKGGNFLSDCVEQEPFTGNNWLSMNDGDGYATWTYDPAGEKKLWNFSLKAVGMEDRQWGDWRVTSFANPAVDISRV
jgi:NAD(P)-dependent dehydrogenase (short-subunit alcohol dehydrogenase family)